MPDLIVAYKASPSTTFILGGDLLSQNEAGNYSTVRFYLRAVNGPGGTTASQFGNAGQQQGHVEGLTHFGTHAGHPFLPGGYQNGALRWHDTYDVNIGHGADGHRAAVTVRMYLGYGTISESLYGTFDNFPRIAKPPATPPTPTLSHVTTNSVRVNGGYPDDMGAPIDAYEFQAATDAAFTQGIVSATNAGPAHDIGGLTPGQRYYFRYRAHNRRGWSGWSPGTPNVFVGLPAPTFASWMQDAAGNLVAAWTAPTVTTGLIGYRLQIAHDAGFTQGVQNLELGNVTQHAVAGLTGGRYWHARVAARTAGGINAYSDALSALLVLSAGDLDGWTRAGVVPAGVAGFTAEGIRRGVAAGRQALLVESLATGAAVLPAGTGIQRTITGLTPGKAYRFEASAILTGTPLAAMYRLRVLTEGDTAPVEVTTDLTDLGYLEFIADTSAVVIQIVLAEPVTIPGPVEAVERVAFSTVRLLELATDYPVRLRETVYESNLANHFDLAANSVGATWYVGKDGVTRFRLPGTALPVSAVFTDQTVPGALHYIDVNAAYDTKGMVNRLDVTNYGVDDERENEENDELVVTSPASIDAYGVRSARLETNLWGEPPYDESLNARLAGLLEAADEPRLFIAGLRWNAQENVAAANALDVGQRILVSFNGTDQDSQIISIQHDITPRRWIVTIALQRL